MQQIFSSRKAEGKKNSIELWIIGWSEDLPHQI